jgi:nucleoside-diphosphate-sugar epimerase
MSVLINKKPKILVTGGAGYVGSVLTPLLLDSGYFVRVVDNLMYNQSTLFLYFLNDNFEFLRGDVCDKELMSNAIKGVDFIIHLAAIVGEPACRKDLNLCYAVNLHATELINKLRSPEQKIIFSSSGTIYGKIEGICTEESPLNPLTSDYSISKLGAEKIIISKDNYIIYRFATGFGLSPRMRLDLLINDFVYRAMKDKVNILYEADAKRTFIHVRDMARSLIFAIENFEDMKNQAYNVGSEKLNFSKREIAQKIKERINYYLDFADFSKDPDQRNYEVSYAKIRKKGFETIIDVDKGIDELIKGYSAICITNPFSNTG